MHLDPRLAALLLILVPPAQGPARPSYTNPVDAHDFPDPFVLRHGGRYYAYATQSGEDDFQVMESPDLVHWTPRHLDWRPPAWGREHL